MADTRERPVEFNGFWLWFGFIGSAALWFIHLNLTYILTAVVCDMGGRFLLYIASLVLGAGALSAGFVAWRNWRKLPQEERDKLIDDMQGTRQTFMTFGGMLASGIFFLGILLATIPLFFLNPCSPTGVI